jgi:hypothetical protein
MLLAIALFGFVVPNGYFLYWLFNEFGSVQEVMSNHLAVAFILDAFIAMGLLAYLFAKRPPGPLGWPWFVGLSILGGLAFSIPLYLWMNFRKTASPHAAFDQWWRTV